MLKGNYVGSSRISYQPTWTCYDRPSVRGHYRCDIETAGSVSLLTQTALPLLLFHPHRCSLTLIGGTNASFAPQIDWFQLVLQPTRKRLMGIEIAITCKQRGFFPKGGGEVVLDTQPLTQCIPAFDLTKRGRMRRIYGRRVIGGGYSEYSAFPQVKGSNFKIPEKHLFFQNLTEKRSKLITS